MYEEYEPIDPRDAFRVAARPDSEETPRCCGLSGRLPVLSMSLVSTPNVNENAKRQEGYELPGLRPLRRSR